MSHNTDPAPGGDATAGEMTDALERLAKAATPGDWEAECIEDTSGPFFHCPGSEQVFRAGWDVRGPLSLGNYESSAFTAEDAAYIAAAQPKNIIALITRLRAAEAERDALRRAVEEIPNVIRKSGEPGEGGVDMTGDIPTCVYVGIGRERYDDDYELARESAAEARDDAARAVEHLVNQARGGAHGGLAMTDMTDEELDAIEAKARAATPGPWVMGTDNPNPVHWAAVYDADGEDGMMLAELHMGENGDKLIPNAAFIAAANPAAVLALVEELKRLRRSPWEIARRMGEEESRDEHDGHSVAIRTVRGEGEAGAGGQTAR